MNALKVRPAQARRFTLAGACLLALMFGAPHIARAQQTWCAEYDDGTKTCGIADEQTCRQSVTGVGGVCVPDIDKGPTFGPRIIQRLFDPGAPLPNPNSNNLPFSNPSDMPPPPVR
jgi:hypothetical protein